MALRPILHFPDPRLRHKAQPVKQVTAHTQTLIDDMLETMYAAPGIGLAATQINVAKRVIVIDISPEQNAPHIFINPEIITATGQRTYEEGCLSVPDAYEEVSRADTIQVKAISREGDTFQLETDGLLATCIQHEIDHLDGKLFVDYLSQLKRQRIKKKLEKQQRQQR